MKAPGLVGGVICLLPSKLHAGKSSLPSIRLKLQTIIMSRTQIPHHLKTLIRQYLCSKDKLNLFVVVVVNMFHLAADYIALAMVVDLNGECSVDTGAVVNVDFEVFGKVLDRPNESVRRPVVFLRDEYEGRALGGREMVFLPKVEFSVFGTLNQRWNKRGTAKLVSSWLLDSGEATPCFVPPGHRIREYRKLHRERRTWT